MSQQARISKRKLVNPVQSPPNLGYDNPILEAEARKTRYVSLSMKELVANNAPLQIWTTERPSTSFADEDAKEVNKETTLRLDLGNYLAKIPISNDRALKGKLDRIVTCSSLADRHLDAYKEPETPSSLPPRNTVPKNNSPTYIPPGRRGSRVSSANADDRPYHHHRQSENPLVQAPLPRRSYSSTSAQELHAAKRNISLRRTSSTDSSTGVVEGNLTFAAAAAAAVQDLVETVVPVARKRGRPRKSANPEVKAAASSRPENLVKTWTKKRVVEIPLVSPSSASTPTASASTADESTLDDEEDEDLDDDDEDEDDTYVPRPSHHKKVKISPAPAAPALVASPSSKAQNAAQQTALNVPQPVPSILIPSIAAAPTSRYVINASQVAHPPFSSALPPYGSFSEKKRFSTETTSSSTDASIQPPPYRKLRLGKPLSIQIKQSGIQASIPRLHSPLSQSLGTFHDQATAHTLPNRAHNPAAALLV